jgi:hypothetical protein
VCSYTEEDKFLPLLLSGEGAEAFIGLADLSAYDLATFKLMQADPGSKYAYVCHTISVPSATSGKQLDISRATFRQAISVVPSFQS